MVRLMMMMINELLLTKLETRREYPRSMSIITRVIVYVINNFNADYEIADRKEIAVILSVMDSDKVKSVPVFKQVRSFVSDVLKREKIDEKELEKMKGDLIDMKGDGIKIAHVLDRVRNLILKKITPNEMDEEDIKRVKYEDWFIQRFIEKRIKMRQEIKIESIADLVIKSLKWRKEFGINHLRTDLIPKEIFGHDASGIAVIGDQVICFSRIKTLIKISGWNDVIFDQVMYFSEYILSTYKRPIISVVDCSGVGFAHYDMSLGFRLAPTISKNYPSLVKKIFYHNIPNALVPIYNTLKRLIPKKYRELIELSNDGNLAEILGGRHNLPPFLGGTLILSKIPTPADSPSIEIVAKERNISQQNVDELRAFLDSIED